MHKHTVQTLQMYFDGRSAEITMNYIDTISNGRPDDHLVASKYAARSTTASIKVSAPPNVNWLIYTYYSRNEYNVCEYIIDEQLRNHVDKEFGYRIKGMIARSDGRLIESLHNLQQAIYLNSENGVNHKEIGQTLYVI